MHVNLLVGLIGAGLSLQSAAAADNITHQATQAMTGASS